MKPSDETHRAKSKKLDLFWAELSNLLDGDRQLVILAAKIRWKLPS